MKSNDPVRSKQTEISQRQGGQLSKHSLLGMKLSGDYFFLGCNSLIYESIFFIAQE